MQNNPFDAFLSLVAFDQKTNQLLKDVTNVERERDTLVKKKNDLVAQEEEVLEQYKQARKAVDMYELRIKEVEEQRSRKNEQINQSDSPREYQSLMKEVDALSVEHNEIEAALVSAWNTLEAAKKARDKRIEEIEQERERLAEIIAQHEVTRTHLLTQIEERNAQRPEMEKNLDSELLTKYNLMKHAVSDPVLPAEDGACSVCFHTIPRQDLLEMERNKLFQCKGCFRFLYSQRKATQ